MQIVIILKKNFKYSTVISTFNEHIQFSEHFQLIFDNLNVNKDKQIKQNMANFFFAKNFRIFQFFLLILLREATLESKVAPTNRNS